MVLAPGAEASALTRAREGNLPPVGLAAGAVTGGLERSGYVRREPDPDDRRKQILFPVPERWEEVHGVIAPLRRDVAKLLDRFDSHQLSAIAEFLADSAEIAIRHAALMRAERSWIQRSEPQTGAMT